MNIILDACTAIHLLQTDIKKNDSTDELSFHKDFFKLLNKLEEKIIILPKVLDEIKDNVGKNLQEYRYRKFLDVHIERDFHKLVEYIDEYKEVIPFVKSSNKYNDDNGELHCTSYALYKSRYLNDTLYENFVFTDDDGAINDFEDFFKINAMGSMLTTIDLLIILYRKNIITKNVVLDFAINLKRLYVVDLNKLLKLIDNAVLSGAKKGIQEKALLSTVRHLLNSTRFNEISDKLLEHSKLYASIKSNNKEFDQLLQKVIGADYEKIKTIDKKIDQLRHKVWEI